MGLNLYLHGTRDQQRPLPPHVNMFTEWELLYVLTETYGLLLLQMQTDGTFNLWQYLIVRQ